MIERLTNIRDEIRSVNERVRKIKHDNYSTIYNNGDLKYFEEIQRTLCISAATVATYLDQLDSRMEQDASSNTVQE